MMDISVLPFSNIEAQHLAAWAQIQASDPTFDSPFFSPEYTEVIASVRSDIHVGVLEQAGDIVGLFPFQRGRRGEAMPVGGDISQFHGVLASQNIAWSTDQLLRSCNINSWSFTHLPTSQTPFCPESHCVGDSPCINLRDGFAAYLAEKRRSGKAIEQAQRKARKMEREVGPLRFELHDDSDAAFRMLLAWKSEQHRRTNVVDAFQADWLVRVLDRLRQTQNDSFAGMMSALYAGDQLVAVHLGLRSQTVAHIWYPAFDTMFGKYSPGITLLLKMTEAWAETGITRIDFAARQQIYKTRFMNGSIPVAKGIIDRSHVKAYLRRNVNAFRECVREAPIAVPVREVRHWLRSLPLLKRQEKQHATN
jgi:CelD/BcsL family acetyltransferase involved in cellulose biosynthesis